MKLFLKSTLMKLNVSIFIAFIIKFNFLLLLLILLHVRKLDNIKIMIRNEMYVTILPIILSNCKN